MKQAPRSLLALSSTKDIAIACGEAGFSEAMIFFRNKAVWLLAQGLACFAEKAKYE
jgi:hypothetical protein